MRVVALALALSVGGLGGVAIAKPKAPPKTQGDAKKNKDGDKNPPPGDPGTNEGGAGRTNATGDAARDAEGPSNATGHRP